jgi:predicted aspartyl protease
MRLCKTLTFKNVHLISLLVVTMIFTNSCNYAKNVKLLTGGSLDRTDFVETIPFEYKKDLIVIEARINDREEKRQFIFDTGAFDSKIEIGLADEINLPTKATKTNSTAQGITQKIDITRLEKVTLGETAFSNISAGKLQYDSGSASRCIAPHGIIGANLMKLANWKIDYQNQEIQFSDRTFAMQGQEIYTLHFDKPLLSGTPEIDIEVAGRTVSGVLFDVGYNGGLILPSWLSGTFSSQDEKTYYDQSTSGIFGTNIDTLITKILDVSLAGFDMKVPVEFSSIGKALLGNDILKHFTVTVDYNDNKITLRPESDVQVDSPYTFIPGILNDSLWVVNRTNPSLPFSLGDTLSSINNKKPEDLFSSFCDYFLNINTLADTDSLLITRVDGSSINILFGN